MPLSQRQLHGDEDAGKLPFAWGDAIRPSGRVQGAAMSDADFAASIFCSLERLDKSCLDFIEADRAIPRDNPDLEVNRQKLFRSVNDCKAELLSHDLLRLDALAMAILQSSRGEWGFRFREDVDNGQAGNVSQLHRRIRRRHSPLLTLVKLLCGRDNGSTVGNVQGEGQQAPIGTRRKIKQPSDDAFKCFRASLVTGRTQSELAELLSRELRRPVDQPTVSRWLKQVKAWLQAGNVLPDLTADSGARPLVSPMDPAKIDRGDGRKKATRPRRSQDANRGR